MAMNASTHRGMKLAGLAVLVLVGLAVAGLLGLDWYLLSTARRQADGLSRRLGRPVAVEGVSTRLLGGLGVKVTGLAIGPAGDEGAPLLELRRAEVQADLWRALLSGGRELVVREAVLDGLSVNVVRLPGGTTNLERVIQALGSRDEAGSAAAPPAPPAPASDRSALRVDRAAVEKARITLLDRTVAGATPLTIDDLDVEVRQLAAGRPLEVIVQAAALSATRNLLVRLRTAPLPPSLSPTLEAVTLQLQPTDLDPLAPFLPASLGLRGGRLQADLVVALGAAIPGGTGPTTVKGTLVGTRLALASQEGGRRLDARLDADLTADATAGDVSIGRLEVALGPAGLTGRGRASGLRGEHPRLDGLELLARGLDLAVLADLYPPLRRQLGGAVVAGPIGLTLRGSGTEAGQAVRLELDLGPVRLGLPRRLEKAAGASMSLTARADLVPGGPVRFEATADLSGTDLRPGGTLAKKPGDPFSAAVAGRWRGAKDGGELTIDRLDVVLLGDRLSGKGRATLGGTARQPTVRFAADLTGERLDLDRALLPAAPERREEGAPAGGKAPGDRWAGVSGTLACRLGLVRLHKADLREVVALVRVEEDTVTLEEARLQAFGGRASAAGTSLRLAHPDAPAALKAELTGVAAEQALAAVSDHQVLSGALDVTLALTSRGWSPEALRRSATGTLRGVLRGGTFHGKDLVSGVMGPLAGRLPAASARVQDLGKTASIGDLPFSLALADGLARLEKPLRVETAQGILEITGGFRLDGALEMPARLSISPEAVARLTGGRARPAGAVPVDFKLAGQAWSPRIEGLGLEAALKAIGGEVVKGGARKLGDEAKKALEGWLGK
jgi:AsmA protein